MNCAWLPPDRERGGRRAPAFSSVCPVGEERPIVWNRHGLPGSCGSHSLMGSTAARLSGGTLAAMRSRLAVLLAASALLALAVPASAQEVEGAEVVLRLQDPR